MSKQNLGLIGWRGMVGSVLMERMRAEGDLNNFQTTFYSTSQVGQKAPSEAGGDGLLADAKDLSSLSAMDIIITCQGGDYTKEIYPKLRQSGWNGYWIDAASALRMDPESVLILDPVNGKVMEEALNQGKKTFVGANCTVSLMLMGIGGLLREGLVDFVSTMTYQAASGGGAATMLELLNQLQVATNGYDFTQRLNALETDQEIMTRLRGANFPTENFGAPLGLSLLPWIDTPVENGQSREEWKGMSETNKILGLAPETIKVDGTCVRVGAMRCHSQGFTIKLKKDVPLADCEAIIREATPWTHFVPNERQKTIEELTPAFVAGSLNVAVGRLRKMNLGPEYLNAFSVGDQLLWGAAEPLRRCLMLLK